jgi:short-subunit dehydrogenase
MKNIVITGASRGIGAELATILSTNNKVLLLARNSEGLKNPSRPISFTDNCAF